MAACTDDTVFHLHGGGEPAIGRAATQEAIATVLAQWPDIRFERKRVHIGDGHFVSEYEMSHATVVCVRDRRRSPQEQGSTELRL